jgi:photosystem II stability/assembly factor-like uncharacterized protein
VRWIAPSPHNADLLLLGIELAGLMRSSDGGESWQDHRPGAQPDVHSLAWHPRVPGRAYEAGGGGAAFSTDAGETWEPADEDRDRHYIWSVTVDPDDPDCWYLSASTGPYAAHGGRDSQARIYRRRGGEPWRPLAGGLPEPLPAMPYALLATDGRLFAGLADGQLWESADRGDSWAALRLRGRSARRPGGPRQRTRLTAGPGTKQQARATTRDARGIRRACHVRWRDTPANAPLLR